MALVYDATITPDKVEVAGGWLAAQSWYDGPAEQALEKVAAYRFDDPAGEVGMETLLLRAGDGSVWQVPLVYAPARRTASPLIATVEHSVLGTRYVHEAPGEPLYAQQLATAIADGTGQVELDKPEGGQWPFTMEVTVRRSAQGLPAGWSAADGRVSVDDGRTVIDAGPVRLAVPHRVTTDDRGADGGSDGTDGGALLGSWEGGPGRVLLATLEVR